MKQASFWLAAVALGAAVFNARSEPKPESLFTSLKDPEIVAQIKRFVADKKAQVDASTNEAPLGFAGFFAAAETGNWLAVSNAFFSLRSHAPQYAGVSRPDARLHGPGWEAVKEVWGGFDAFEEGNEKYSGMFGRDIIGSIPPGSIYFGGTDPGRFIITAMCRSQVNGDPFFVITQNALADATYLQYLRQIYGSKIYIPSDKDSERCFNEYLADATKRLETHLIKPGESVSRGADGRVTVSGVVAVMEINGLIVKDICEGNPNRELYLEESYALDWMYPQLEPHGLIFKLNRRPLPILSEEIVQRDHEYWVKYIRPMLGNWLYDDTPVKEVAEFVKKTFQRQDFSEFKGDPQFIENGYSHKMFSKLRSSIGGLYAWRARNPADAADKERMARAADFAYRQAWALCPYSPEAVYRYVEFLASQNRGADAMWVASTATVMPSLADSDRKQLYDVMEKLKQQQNAK